MDHRSWRGVDAAKVKSRRTPQPNAMVDAGSQRVSGRMSGQGAEGAGKGGTRGQGEQPDVGSGRVRPTPPPSRGSRPRHRRGHGTDWPLQRERRGTTRFSSTLEWLLPLGTRQRERDLGFIDFSLSAFPRLPAFATTAFLNRESGVRRAQKARSSALFESPQGRRRVASSAHARE